MKYSLLIFLLFTISTGFAQETDTSPKLYSDTIYTDVIYPRFQKELISKCKIIDISDGNIIKFELNGVSNSMEAKAIIKDGIWVDFTEIIFNKRYTNNKQRVEYDSLNTLTFNGQNYMYYHNQYLKSKKMRKRGMVFSAIGLPVLAIGIPSAIFMNSNPNIDLPLILFFVPVILTAGGLTFTIIGAINFSIGQHNLEKNYNAMQKCTDSKTSLNIGMTKNGIGLILNF